MTSPSARRKKLDETGTRINVEIECLVKHRPTFKDVADEAGLVAGAVVIEEPAATTVVEGVTAATSAVQDINLRLSRTVIKGKNALSVLHLDIKGNMLSTRLMCVRKRLCLTPACKTPN